MAHQIEPGPTQAASSGHIGKRLLRVEDDKLLKGRGQFVDDLRMPELVHLAFVRSPHAHARIRAIESAAAASLPGVIGVFTGHDFIKLCKPMRVEVRLPGYKPTERSVLATGKVRFVGEAVAVVVAESRYIAEDGVDFVTVDYEPLPAVSDVERALEVGAPLVHDEVGSNVVFQSEFKAGDVEEAFASAYRVLSETFRCARVAGVPLEGRGCVAKYDVGRGVVTVWSSTQIPHLLRTSLAELLGMPETRIRVIAPDVGGGFGTKAHVYPEELITTALAIKLQRPVKWVQDRREDLMTSIHARDHVYHVEVAVRQNGVIQGVKLRLLTNAGAYASPPFGCTLEPTGGGRVMPGPYKFRNYAYDAYGVSTHTCPSGAYRGVAQVSAFFAIEGMMDRIGRVLGIDPAEVRFRNLIQLKDLPYVNVVGVRYDTGSYTQALQRALEMAGYDEYRKRQTAARKENGKYRGIGICCMTEITGIGSAGWAPRGVSGVPGFDSALIKVEPTGQVTAVLSTATQGQGHETTFAQLIAEQLGVRMDDVVVLEGDTSLGPYGTGTFASRSVIAAGGATLKAVDHLKDKMLRIAAHLLEANPHDVVLQDGYAAVRGVPSRSVSVREIAQTAYSMIPARLPSGEEFGLESIAYYDPPPVTIANAVHIAQVAVDARTGRIQVERYVVVHDCGRIINPMIVDGQIHGGTAQGLGEALMEAMVYDEEGQLLSASLMDYLLPTAMDMPWMEIDHIETPSIDTRGGFKGVGEGGVIGSLPALANAVGDALAGIGAAVNVLPLSPDRVLTLIEGKGDGGRQ